VKKDTVVAKNGTGDWEGEKDHRVLSVSRDPTIRKYKWRRWGFQNLQKYIIFKYLCYVYLNGSKSSRLLRFNLPFPAPQVSKTFPSHRRIAIPVQLDHKRHIPYVHLVLEGDSISRWLPLARNVTYTRYYLKLNLPLNEIELNREHGMRWGVSR